MYVGVELPLGHHVTIAFFGHNESLKDYSLVVAATAKTIQRRNERGMEWPLFVDFGDLDVFEGKRAVWHVQVFSEDIESFREELLMVADSYGLSRAAEHEYIPHVTLAYNAKPTENPYQDEFFAAEYVSVVSDKHGHTRIKI